MKLSEMNEEDDCQENNTQEIQKNISNFYSEQPIPDEPSFDNSMSNIGNSFKTANSNMTQDSVGTEFNNTRFSTSSWIVKTLQGEDQKIFKRKKREKNSKETLDDEINQMIREKERRMYGFSSKMKSLCKYSNVVFSIIFDNDILFKKYIRFMILIMVFIIDALFLSVITLLNEDYDEVPKKASGLEFNKENDVSINGNFFDLYNILFTTIVGYCVLLAISGSLRVSKGVFNKVENDREFFETICNITKTQDVKLKLLCVFFTIIHILAYVQIIQFGYLNKNITSFWLAILLI